MNKRKPYCKNAWVEGEGTRWLRHMEYQKSRVCCKVEFAFHIIKDFLGFRKARYRGLKKLEAKAYMLFASANFYMILMGKRKLIEAAAKRSFGLITGVVRPFCESIHKKPKMRLYFHLFNLFEASFPQPFAKEVSIHRLLSF